MNTKTDKHFMSIALELAEKGHGLTSPNPMVGAIVVRDGQIVGRGYHRKAGSDHAEIIALREAADNASGATLYVTMEPCCHHGKTPPCTDAIIKSGIKRVVSAMIDVNPVVSGRGFGILQQNNIETLVGIYEHNAQKLNEAYMKFIREKIPFVTLKLAVTLDGKTADPNGKSKWITGPETQKHIHLLRSWSDAVMVGIGTVLADNPMLTVREVKGSDPLRVIVDEKLRTPLNAKVLADKNVVVATTKSADKKTLSSFVEKGIEVWEFGSGDELVPLTELMKRLGERDITSLFCEGGSTLGAALLNERLVDKVIFAVAPKILGNGLDALRGLHIKSIDDMINLKDVEVKTTGNDIIITGYPEYR